MKRKHLIIFTIVWCLLIIGAMLWLYNIEHEPPPEPEEDWNKTVLGPDIEILVSKDEAEKKAIEIVKEIEGIEPEIKYSMLNEESLRPWWDIGDGKNDDRGSVGIDANNGEIIMYLRIKNAEQSDTFPTQEEALKIANNFFKKLNITLPKDAEFKDTYLPSDSKTLYIRWSRKIDGIPTKDTIEVGITSDGEVYSYLKNSWPDIEPQKAKITKEEAEQKAKEQLQKYYEFKTNTQCISNELAYVHPDHYWKNNRILKVDRNVRLCYEVWCKSGNSLLIAQIDAQTGELVGGGMT